MTLNLTPTQRRAVEMKARGATRAQVAERLGISPQAVKKLWARARVRALADMDERRRRSYVAALEMSAKPRTVQPRSLSGLQSV